MKKLKAFVQVILLPYILSLVVRFIYLSNKKIFHFPTTIPEGNFIVATWHGELLMQALAYKKFKKDGKIKVIVSEHRDGETIRKLVKHLGIDSISGSSTRGGAKALLSAIKSIKNGIDIAITPDGPKGPRYGIADGIVVIAQKTNSPIMSFSIQPSKYWEFNSWDKFILPKPFGTIEFFISEAFSVSDLSMPQAKELIDSKMRRINV